MKTKIKKNLIKTMVITTFCCLGFAVAMFPASVNASAASLEEGKFEMIDGASIRIGSQLTGGQTDDSNGIRFSAEIDVDTYDTLKANNDSVTAGTFIMPYDYIDWFGALTEENCFGVNAKYYWQTAGFADGETPVYNTDTANRTQIRHVAATAYKTESEIQTNSATPVEVYRINGSLVNILDENLGRSMIGVSYLAATKDNVTTYYFAETDAEANQRSIAHVSQNILLKDGVEGTYSGYATEYLNKYLEVNPNLTVEIKADCYEINENGYTKIDTIVEETVSIDDVSDFTAIYGEAREADWAPTLEGYKYVSGHQKNEETGILKLDGSASYEYYFYAENNFVLYDGSYAPTVAENLTKFMGKSVVVSGGALSIKDGWTPNAYEIDNTPDGLGAISASKYQTGFGVGESLRWVDFGDGQSSVQADWTWNNDPSLRTGYVELEPSMAYTFTMRVKTVKDSDVAAGLQGKSLKLTFAFMNTEKNFENIEVDIANQLYLIAENDGWYTITGTLNFVNGAPGQYITQLIFQTSTSTPIHLDIDYISLKPAQ